MEMVAHLSRSFSEKAETWAALHATSATHLANAGAQKPGNVEDCGVMLPHLGVIFSFFKLTRSTCRKGQAELSNGWLSSGRSSSHAKLTAAARPD